MIRVRIYPYNRKTSTTYHGAVESFTCRSPGARQNAQYGGVMMTASSAHPHVTTRIDDFPLSLYISIDRGCECGESEILTPAHARLQTCCSVYSNQSLSGVCVCVEIYYYNIEIQYRLRQKSRVRSLSPLFKESTTQRSENQSSPMIATGVRDIYRVCNVVV